MSVGRSRLRMEIGSSAYIVEAAIVITGEVSYRIASGRLARRPLAEPGPQKMPESDGLLANLWQESCRPAC
jgi:hypothetical protein